MESIKPEFDEGKPVFHGTGHLQEVNQQRLEAIEQKWDPAMDYAVKAKVHLWVVIVTYQASDQMLDGLDGKTTDVPILDADNMISQPQIGCLICEQVYEPRLRLRKCAGEPK